MLTAQAGFTQAAAHRRLYPDMPNIRLILSRTYKMYDFLFALLLLIWLIIVSEMQAVMVHISTCASGLSCLFCMCIYVYEF